MCIFKKKSKEDSNTIEAQPKMPNIGDYVICGLYHKIYMYETNKISVLKGYVEDIFEDNIKVNNEWYKMEYSVGGIYIKSIIKGK